MIKTQTESTTDNAKLFKRLSIARKLVLNLISGKLSAQALERVHEYRMEAVKNNACPISISMEEYRKQFYVR